VTGLLGTLGKLTGSAQNCLPAAAPVSARSRRRTLRIMSLMQISRVPAEEFAAAVPDLADVLVDAVGFVLPFAADAARRWWATVESGVADGRTLLWVARDEVGVVGTVQLKLELVYSNGRHRAEVSKLLVHRRGRGLGVGRALLAAAERGAVDSGCTLRSGARSTVAARCWCWTRRLVVRRSICIAVPVSPSWV